MLLPAGSRRGSYIAEAAVVFPFVILAVITVVLIVMFFYQSSLAECRMHMALRCEAGLVTEKYSAYGDDGIALSPEDLWDGSVTSSGVRPAKRVSGAAEVSMVSRGLLSKVGRRRLTGSIRALDPAALLRIRQAVSGSIDAAGSYDGDNPDD